MGPYKFWGENKSVYSDDNKNLPGIYLWTFKTDKGYMIHYVGQTTNFAERHKTHLVNILGLSYGIFDADEAQRGIQKIIWKGLWRDKKSLSFNGELKTVYSSIHSDTIKYIDSIDIFFAELEESNNLRTHVEGSIGWNLRNNHKEFKALYPDDNHIGMSRLLGWKLRILNSSDILGLDNEIDI